MRRRSQAIDHATKHDENQSGVLRSNQSGRERRELAERECSARKSCGGESDGGELRAGFAVFKTIRDNPKSKRLNSSLCLVFGRTVREYARKIWNFRDPASVCFLFELN